MKTLMTTLVSINAVETLFIVICCVLIMDYIAHTLKWGYIAFHEKTGSKGIKNLKFQKYNSAWNTFVIQYIRR